MYNESNHSQRKARSVYIPRRPYGQVINQCIQYTGQETDVPGLQQRDRKETDMKILLFVKDAAYGRKDLLEAFSKEGHDVASYPIILGGGTKAIMRQSGGNLYHLHCTGTRRMWYFPLDMMDSSRKYAIKKK